MPIATVRGVDIHYEVLGERGPFVVLQPGGRRAGAGVRSLGEKIAEAGYRVVAYDRRNTGASSIAIEGESENDEWVEDLHELLAGLDALPAYIEYEVLGERGPFVVLQPGGRRAGAGVRSLGEKIAEAGYRVVAYDRRNTGASSIAIEGESENDEWVEDLHELLAGLDALPAYI